MAPGGTGSPRPAVSSPASTPDESEGPDWQKGVATLGDVTVTYRYDGAQYRPSPDGRTHLLGHVASDDPEALRWADLFLIAPTVVYDRKGAPKPLPDDPVAWLRDHPGQRILRERTVRVMGTKGVELAVNRDGAELFGDEAGGMEGDGIERYVLWRLDDTWLLLQASTFRGRRGVLAPDRADELVPQVLASLESAEK